jgi:hypothetical protein
VAPGVLGAGDQNSAGREDGGRMRSAAGFEQRLLLPKPVPDLAQNRALDSQRISDLG